MIITGLVLAAIAALVHVYIFYMESIAWTAQKTRAVFGVTPKEAEATKSMAFNQGFYNLFLAILVVVGGALYVAGGIAVNAAGAALVFAGAGSMAAAALVLFVSSSDNRAAALKQGAIPLLGVVAFAIGLAV